MIDRCCNYYTKIGWPACKGRIVFNHEEIEPIEEEYDLNDQTKILYK